MRLTPQSGRCLETTQARVNTPPQSLKVTLIRLMFLTLVVDPDSKPRLSEHGRAVFIFEGPGSPLSPLAVITHITSRCRSSLQVSPCPVLLRWGDFPLCHKLDEMPVAQPTELAWPSSRESAAVY